MADLITMMAAAAGASAGGDYQISRSLRFNSADSAYLSRTPASAGNRKTFTFSAWCKRSALTNASLFNVGATSGTSGFTFFIYEDNQLKFGVNESGTVKRVITNALFRDVSAWYHVLVAVDTTQATSTNRTKIYVNGVEQTYSSAAYVNQDFETLVNTTISHRIGQYLDSGGNPEYYPNMYMADINFIDGQALTPSSFGEVDATTGVWKPIRYAGTYGTNGFHLDFSDNSSTTALGYDAAGSNDWTVNNFSVTAGAGNDSLVDSPTQYGTDTGAGGEVRGNYCTLNPLNNVGGSTLTNGNLDFVTGVATYGGVKGTIGVSSGKWYWEVTATASTTVLSFGIQNASGGAEVGGDANGWGYLSDARKYNNGSASAYGASYTTNDVIGVALDLDAGTLAFYKNGSAQGTAFSGLAANTYFPAVSDVSTGASSSGVANFGQRPFAYTAPSGFKALCTTNLPDPTVVQGDDHFNTVLRNGFGTSGGTVTTGFYPDLIWEKQRNGLSNHFLVNSITGGLQTLNSNSTAAEVTEANWITSFSSTGYTHGSNDFGTGDTVAVWAWNANSGSSVSNTDGTITSTVSANTTAGISIVTYTGNGTAGATVGHGLGAVPRMIIIKARNATESWQVGHVGLDATNPWQYRIYLNLTTQRDQTTLGWNDTAPTSTVFSLNASSLSNTNNNTHVAYCFAEVEGFSKFGSYTGNGSADGPFIYTGFRPAWVMFKCSSSDQGGNAQWGILDTTRNTYNVVGNRLNANSSGAEGSGDPWMDITANGFKIRETSTAINGSGATYIYMAFAEHPFKNSLAR